MKNWNNSDDLAEMYADDLKPLKAVYNYFRDRRNIYLKLTNDCENEGEWELAESFRLDYLEYRERAKEIGAIISSSQFSIDWLRQGYEPVPGKVGSSATQKVIALGSSSDVDQALVYLNQLKTEYSEMTEEELQELHIFLQGMTPQEKDVFISIKGQGNTFKQTAQFMGISKSTVQKYLKRAEKKVEKHLEIGIQTALF